METMFLKDNLNYEESCFETESRNGDRLNAEVYDNELEGFLRLDAEQGLYWKEPLMRYLVQVLHMNGEYGAEDPMDNEAVFRDADDLSGFDRTQAWESACEQMNQLGIEEGNLQYKESYCMHIEDLEEQTQRLLRMAVYLHRMQKKAGQRTRRVIYSIFSDFTGNRNFPV